MFVLDAWKGSQYLLPTSDRIPAYCIRHRLSCQDTKHMPLKRLDQRVLGGLERETMARGNRVLYLLDSATCAQPRHFGQVANRITRIESSDKANRGLNNR